MDVVIETPRLRLRTWSEGDREEIRRIYGDERVVRYLGDGTVRNSDEAIDGFLARRVQSQQAAGVMLWAVVERSSERLIGTGGLQPLQESGWIEVGYHLEHDAWGKGYATEIGVASLRHGFEVQGFEAICGIARATNVASCRVLEKIGLAHGGERHFYDTDVEFYSRERAPWLEDFAETAG